MIEFLKIIPKHEGSFSITHNSHKDTYETAEDYLNSLESFNGLFTDQDFCTKTSKEQIIKTNEIWECRWYPNTPVGFVNFYGATFGEIFNKLKENGE